MAKPPGLERPTESARLRSMTSKRSLVLGEEVAALVVDDVDLGQDVAGEVADHVGVKRLEHGAIAFGDRHVLGAGVQRDLGRDASAELDDESLRRRLDDVRVDHRQEVEVCRLLVGQIAHDADRAIAVDVKAEIGVGRHRRQTEAGVVGQIQAQNADRNSSKPQESRTARRSRRLFSRPGICARRPRPCSRWSRASSGRMSAAATKWPANASTPDTTNGTSARRPPGPNDHATQAANHSASGAAIKLAGVNTYIANRNDQAAKPGAGKVGEIDAAENAVAPEKDASQEKRAGQERRQLRQENRQTASTSAPGPRSGRWR